MMAGSNLENVLESGQFAVTAELGPPKGTNLDAFERRATMLRDCCDAVNVTDNQTAITRLCSLAGCIKLKSLGVEPVMQMTCRDRNRIAIQSDILGALAFGIQNVLCLSGDHQSFGNHPTAKGVFDIDSIQLVGVLRKMRDEHKFMSDDAFNGEAPLYIGAAANPYADPFEFRVVRLDKKVRSGASFIQTQGVYDVDRFERFMAALCDKGLDKQVHVLAGIIPVRSARMAKYMQESVAGITVPDEIVKRMEGAADAKAEGLAIALEIIERVRKIPGVHGIHIMAVGWEDSVPTIVERAGLLPRPKVQQTVSSSGAARV
ncbi:MAG: methylenetetrahydrofolate reductase [Chloroflexi bacterium]|nr:methylenetetrahydrofolate reductase [Chloroflexota bacterium]MCL5025388.1 methylenetetrahydrofolate reductase [Chloroflexota bacterium]